MVDILRLDTLEKVFEFKLEDNYIVRQIIADENELFAMIHNLSLVDLKSIVIFEMANKEVQPNRTFLVEKKLPMNYYRWTYSILHIADWIVCFDELHNDFVWFNKKGEESSIVTTIVTADGTTAKSIFKSDKKIVFKSNSAISKRL